MGLASSHLSRLLLVRSKSQVLPTLEGWSRHKGVGTIPGRCRVHRQFLTLFVDLVPS